MSIADGWKGYVGKTVVVDTDSDFVYLGRLERVTEEFVHLGNVDVHDRKETPSTKERYVQEARRHGVNPNRREVAIRLVLVVSLSLLEDVLEF